MLPAKSVYLTILWLALCQAVEDPVSTNITPFCQTCTCYNQTATNPDVDCSNRLVVAKLYDNSMWFDNGTMYSIKSLMLRQLDIRDLTDVFPKSNLQLLDLSNNGLKKIGDGVFKNLQNMVELILSHNELDSIQPHAFMGLRLDGFDYPIRSLRILRLDNNNIHSLDSDVFQHIERDIEELYLGNNPLKTLDQSTTIAIVGIIDLKVLDLSYTGIANLPDFFLHTPKDLIRLDLSGNRLTSIPKTLEDAHVLRELILDNNWIDVLNKSNGFPIAKTVKVLHMCNMPNLTHIDRNSMAGLENLEELYITNNPKLSKIHYDALIRTNVQTYVWPIVKKLDLSNNQLSYLNNTFLGKWDTLVSLDIRGNPWTCECENQWIIDELVPIYLTISAEEAKQVTCGAPIEMEGQTLFDIYEKKSIMRCLDLYGNRPENDGTILVGMLLGVLLAIPCILFIIYAYQRNWFGLFDKSPAAYSRQFYRPPSMGEEF